VNVMKYRHHRMLFVSPAGREHNHLSATGASVGSLPMMGQLEFILSRPSATWVSDTGVFRNNCVRRNRARQCEL
jgi:hypothetical protein